MRAHYLRLRPILGFVSSLPVLLLLASCGGGGGSSTPPNPVVFTKSMLADSGGAAIDDATRGIKVQVPAGTFSSASSVTLEVLDHQRPGAVPQGYSSTANAINIIVDVTHMTADGKLQLQIPFGETF